MQTQVIVRIHEEGADAQRLQELSNGLRLELLDLDVEGVAPVPAGPAPAGSRAAEVVAVGALLVSIKSSAELLRNVVNAVRSWLRGRRDEPRAVEVTIGDKTIRLTNATSDQQQRMVDEFVNSVAYE